MDEKDIRKFAFRHSTFLPHFFLRTTWLKFF